MITFYAGTAGTCFAPWSMMRDSQERWKDEATPRLARGASASFLILPNRPSTRLTVRAASSGKPVQDGRAGLANACPKGEAKPKGLTFARLWLFINAGGKPQGMHDGHLSYHDFIRPHEIYDLFR